SRARTRHIVSDRGHFPLEGPEKVVEAGPRGCLGSHVHLNSSVRMHYSPLTTRTLASGGDGHDVNVSITLCHLPGDERNGERIDQWQVFLVVIKWDLLEAKQHRARGRRDDSSAH